MAITVGDAVFNFLGDTTQLDQAWQKAETDASAKAPVVQQQINTMGQAWDQAGQQAQNAAQQTTQAAEQMATAAQGAGAASAEAAQVASPEWLALAKATDSATRATIEHSAAQKELEAAIAKAAQSTEGDQAALAALAAAEEKVAIAAANLAAAQKETEIASQAATASMRAEAEAAAQSSIALKEAATAALTFGQDSKLAGEQAAYSMQEAKGSLALVSEETGVTIPRHLRGFIAELPGVGAALEAAFSGIALLVLVQLIVEATEKLTDFVSETFIYTDAEKEAYAATLELNKTLGEQAQKLKELQNEYRLIGLEGTAKTKEEFMILTEEVNKNEAALRAAQNTLARYREEQRSGADFSTVHTVTEEQANAAGAAILALTALLKTQYQQQAAFEKQYDQESLQEQIQHGEASINAEKTKQEAMIELARAESTLRLTLAKAGYSSLIEAQQDFDNQMYQAKLKALQDSLANEAKDPTRNQDRIKELNAQIEALEDQHQAKMLEIRTKGVQALQAALKAALAQTVSTPITDIIPLPDDVNVRLQAITDLLQQFGIKSSQTWQKEVDDAQAAFDKLKASGVATYSELLQVREKLAEAKLGQAVDRGDLQSAEEYRQELEAIRKEMEALGIVIDNTSNKQQRWNSTHNSTIHLLDQWAAEMRKTRGELNSTQKAFDAIITDTSAAFGNAIEAWILGQESLGKALRQALAEEAASLAARAIMYGLYYTAWGIADLFWHPDRAGADFASAAEFFAVAALAGAFAYAVNPGRSEGGQAQAPQTEAAAGIQQGPVEQAAPQTQNVPRFATGGLVMGPTLAIIGDAMNGANSAQAALSGPGQTEAILPLDKDTMRRLADELVPHMPKPTVVVNVHGKSISHLIKEINHAVTHNDAPLQAKTAYRVTRKA